MDSDKKAFWTSKESLGAWLVVGALGAAGIYFWGKIVPFLVDMVFDTTKLIIGGAVLALLITIIASPRTRLVLRLLSRAITGLIINIDPIGILKDRVAQMLKRMEAFSEKKESLSGAARQVKSAIDANDKEISKQQRVAVNARAAVTQETDPTRKLRMNTELQVAVNEVARLTESNKEYRQLDTTLTRIQDGLERATIYLDGYIRDGQNEAREWERKRKTSGLARGAISDAMSILRGKASEQDLYQSTLTHLADEYDMRIGQIDEGLKDLESFMTKVDLQTGIVDTEAFALVDNFEKKLALPARSAVVELPKTTTGSTDYARLFGGKKE